MTDYQKAPEALVRLTSSTKKERKKERKEGRKEGKEGSKEGKEGKKEGQERRKERKEGRKERKEGNKTKRKNSKAFAPWYFTWTGSTGSKPIGFLNVNLLGCGQFPLPQLDQLPGPEGYWNTPAPQQKKSCAKRQ